MELRIVRARNTDPSTSHQGAADVEARALSQMMRLLLEFAEQPLIDEMAAQRAGIGPGYWKRCSDLRTNGWIKPVRRGGALVTHTSSAGSEAMVCWITEEGVAELRRRGLSRRQRKEGNTWSSSD